MTRNKLGKRAIGLLVAATLMPPAATGFEPVPARSSERTPDRVETVQDKRPSKSRRATTGQHRSKRTKKARKRAKHALATAGITAAAARTFARQKKVRKRKDLPPGIRKTLERGKPLPAGIETRKVPKALRKELPVHEGHEWRIAGSDLILLSKDDDVVADVLEDVLE